MATPARSRSRRSPAKPKAPRKTGSAAKPKAKAKRPRRKAKSKRVAAPRKTTAAASEARRQLIDVQKRVSKRLKDEIKSSLGSVSPAVEIYYEEYNRELQGFDRLATKAELLDRVLAADIVYQGDYHTLHQSQRTLCRILAEVVERRPRIILGMEMVHMDHQEPLDRYMAGELEDEAFLEAINYEEHWGFPWANYKEILELCRRKNIQVLAINSEPVRRKDRIIERDFRTAAVLVEAAERDPDALIYVFDGDLHVAPDHLPLIVNTLLQRRGLTRRRLIIYQNAEAIYWQLAARCLEHEANVVRVAPDAYCIINATPIERLQSYINWQQHQVELEPVLAGWDDDGGADYSEQVYQLVQMICQLLEIERDDLDDLVVYTTRDLDFLRLLERDRDFTQRDIAEIKRQILSSESYFIPKGNIIYLADLAVNHAAEEAAHFVHSQCAGYAEDPLPPFVDFYYRALREALGFLGSKIVTHTRETWHEDDLAELLANKPNGRLDPKTRVLRSAARYVIQHRRFERAILKGRTPPRLKAIYHQTTDGHLAITHLLGYMLGERLYRGLLAGIVSIAAIRDLFHRSFDADDDPFRTYIELVAELQPIDDDVGRKSDRL